MYLLCLSIYLLFSARAAAWTVSRPLEPLTLIVSGPEKGNRKRGSKPYLFSARAPNAKRDKLSVTFLQPFGKHLCVRSLFGNLFVTFCAIIFVEVNHKERNGTTLGPPAAQSDIHKASMIVQLHL